MAKRRARSLRLISPSRSSRSAMKASRRSTDQGWGAAVAPAPVGADVPALDSSGNASSYCDHLVYGTSEFMASSPPCLAHLADILDLDDATNDRLLAERDLLPGIGIYELVFGLPHYRIVNAAFCHAHPLGSRFNGPERGAWYAAFELATAQAEVAFHKSVELAEVDWREQEIVAYDDYLADFSAELHDIRDARFADCLAPGIAYPSVRPKGGTCAACFRPALVTNVRKGRTIGMSGRAENGRGLTGFDGSTRRAAVPRISLALIGATDRRDAAEARTGSASSPTPRPTSPARQGGRPPAYCTSRSSGLRSR
jgi:hypothetical protein